MSAIAIVGLACIFPGAKNLNAFWRNILDGVDAISDVPPNRWDPVYYDPSSSAPDRFYCRRGGFIDDYAEFDALEFGVMPVEAQSAEPDQLLALQVASQALADAGYDRRPFQRDRTGVIVGRGNYMSAGMARLDQHVRAAEQLAACFRSSLPAMTEKEVESIKAAFQAQLGSYAPGNAIGLVPNLTASRIANRLDLQGPAYTVDAACASALVAIDQACQQLAGGRCDLVLVGGVHLTHDVTFWSVFSQLGALSRNQQIRPFDRRADGLLIGEGVGFVVLRRLADAERDGHRVYAVIRGAGVASDGRASSLMNPRIEGQVLALERAWAGTGSKPEFVGLIEAHGTGTPIGDAAELGTLARFFGSAGKDGKRAGLGSVKSMIGHTMPAAGIAGLIKTALALHHAILPPTLHCEEPHGALTGTRFRLVDRAESWERNGVPRLAGVNAFGFGGINAHVVLEEYSTVAAVDDRRFFRRFFHGSTDQTSQKPLLVFAAQSPEELLIKLDSVDETAASQNGFCRLAIFDPTPERLARARDIVSRGEPWRGRDDFWFAKKGLIAQGGRMAFMFPGVDLSFKPRVDDIAARLNIKLPAIADSESLQETGIAVLEINRILYQAVRELGIRPDAIAGHSIGEWSGLIAAGAVAEGSVDSFISTLWPDSLEVPDVEFVAAGCGARKAAGEIADLEAIAISHDNCPHQVILCGRQDSVDKATRRLRARGVLCQKLPFRSGFHSPHFQQYLAPFREKMKCFGFRAPTIPLWSATTCSRYPEDTESIESLVIEHLIKPVRLRELTETLYQQNFRVFVQIGSGSLTGFVNDTLRDRPFCTVQSNIPTLSGLDQLQRLAAALFVEGLDGVRLDSGMFRSQKKSAPIKLSLGVPLVRLPNAASGNQTLPVIEEASGLLNEFNTSFAEIASSQEAVRRAWQSAQQQPPTRRRRSETRQVLSVDAMPVLIDHCFFRQADSCTSLLERYPVVPMTTSIEMMIGAVRTLEPGRVVVAVRNLRSYKWLAVFEPVEAIIRASFDENGTVAVAIDGYIEASADVADAFTAPPASSLSPLTDEQTPLTSAEGMYRHHWMFHGPAFQGVSRLGPVGNNGIRGTIRSGSVPGATLDNAGQLLGYWVMVSTDRNRLAVPTGIDEIRFFGPNPAEGTEVVCDVRIRMLDSTTVRADMELSYNGRLWCCIRGWEDRRFETDDRLWPVVREPERHLVSEIRPEGYSIFRDRYGTANSRDYLSRRFLCESERKDYLDVGPRRQRQWLAGRIAAKDAARAWLWSHGYGPIFPAQIAVSDDTAGRPVVAGPFREDLRVSIAHKNDVAVAMVANGVAARIESIRDLLEVK